MVSLVGSGAVKYFGSGAGKAGGPCGAGAGVSAAGAAGTWVWALACINGRVRTSRAAALVNRADRRVNLFLLISWFYYFVVLFQFRGNLPDFSLYLDLYGDREPAAHTE